MALAAFLTLVGVSLAALATMISCFIIVVRSFFRSGVVGTPAYPPPYLGALWRYSRSTDFVHPHRRLVASGLRWSLIVVLLAGLGAGLAVAASPTVSPTHADHR